MKCSLFALFAQLVAFSALANVEFIAPTANYEVRNACVGFYGYAVKIHNSKGDLVLSTSDFDTSYTLPQYPNRKFRTLYYTSIAPDGRTLISYEDRKWELTEDDFKQFESVENCRLNVTFSGKGKLLRVRVASCLTLEETNRLHGEGAANECALARQKRQRQEGDWCSRNPGRCFQPRQTNGSGRPESGN